MKPTKREMEIAEKTTHSFPLVGKEVDIAQALADYRGELAKVDLSTITTKKNMEWCLKHNTSVPIDEEIAKAIESYGDSDDQTTS